MFVAGGAGTVLNYATVTGGSADGVCLYEGGIVTNGASGATAGLIEGYAWGVEVHNSAGTVVNFATIESTGAATSSSGVDLLVGGTVTNQQSGLIQGSDGVDIAGGSGTVTNSGTIESIDTSSTAVSLIAGGSVSNAGTGLISAGADGVVIFGTAGTVVNSATISGANLGVWLEAGGASTKAGEHRGHRHERRRRHFRLPRHRGRDPRQHRHDHRQ